MQDVKSVTPRQMAWLRSGGRDFLYKLIEEMEEKLQRLGLIGDFSATIWLPTDVIVNASVKDGGGAFWTFSEEKLEEAREFARRVKEANPEAKVTVSRARGFMGIRGNVIMTDFNWHGDEGAAIIFGTIEQIFEAVELSDSIVRAELITDLGLDKPVRLPFFIPKLGEEEMLEFASERCREGDFLIMPDKRVFKKTGGAFMEATGEDIAEMALFAL